MMECALNGFYTATQRKRFQEAVFRRRSIRKFAGEPDAVADSALQYAAGKVCLPGVRIELGSAQPDALFRRLLVVGGIVGTGRYAAVIVDDFVPESMLHAGISGEALVLEAVSLGLGACWLGSFKRSGVKIPLRDNERLAAIIALGIPGETPGPMRRKKLTDICYGEPSRWPQWAYNAAESLRCAPSAINLQPWRLNYAGRSMEMMCTRFAGDLDLGIGLLHMSLGVGEREHQITLGQGKKVACMIVEDGE